VALTVIGLNATRGPAWLDCADPDYVYLLNGMLIAAGDVAPYSDHPGTTLHLVHGAAIAILHHFRGIGSVTEDVVTRPEFYLRVLNGTWAFLVCLGLFWLGAAVLKRTGALWLAVLAQATPMLSTANIEALYRVNPEPAMLGLGLVILALVFWGGPEWTSGWRRLVWAVVAGGLAGFGLGMKLSFLPVVLVAVGGVVGLGYQVFCLVVASGVFGALVYSPFVNTGNYIFRFGGELLRGTQQYAGTSGAVTWVTLANTFWEWVLSVAAAEWPILCVLATGTAVLVWCLKSRSQTAADPELRWQLRTLAFMVVAGVLQMALAFKGLNLALRYLVPAWSMAGGTLALCLLVVVRLRPEWRPRRPRLAAATLVVLVIAVAAVRALTCGQELTAARERGLAAGCRLTQEFPRHRVVQYAGVPSVEVALAFGNLWSRRRLSEELCRAYPEYVFFNLTSGWLEDFSGPVDPKTVFDGTAAVLLWGGAESRLETSRWAQQMFSVGGQYVYRVDPAIVAMLSATSATPGEPGRDSVTQ
jgi:hypothetical protein